MRSRILSPFQRLGQKAKQAAQRFVIKTVEKHNVMNASSGGVPDAFSSGLLLSLLSARRPSENEHLSSFQALSIQDYLLTSHPHADFFYLRPRDLAATPWILMGKFEVSVSAWIYSNVHSEDRVLILGGGQGYHALTVAKKVESAGKLFVLATSPEDRAVLELNIHSNMINYSSMEKDFTDYTGHRRYLMQEIQGRRSVCCPELWQDRNFLHNYRVISILPNGR